AGLGGGIVGLADRALQAGAGGGVDDARIDLVAGPALVAPVVHGVGTDAEMALQVHGHDGVPLGLGHRGKHAVAVDPGVVQHHMQVTPGFDGLPDGVLAVGVVGDVGGVDRGAAAGGEDVIDDPLGGVAIDVVDQHAGAFAGEDPRMGSTQPAAGAGNDHYSVVQNSHLHSPVRLLSSPPGCARSRHTVRSAWGMIVASGPSGIIVHRD